MVPCNGESENSWIPARAWPGEPGSVVQDMTKEVRWAEYGRYSRQIGGGGLFRVCVYRKSEISHRCGHMAFREDSGSPPYIGRAHSNGSASELESGPWVWSRQSVLVMRAFLRHGGRCRTQSQRTPSQKGVGLSSKTTPSSRLLGLGPWPWQGDLPPFWGGVPAAGPASPPMYVSSRREACLVPRPFGTLCPWALVGRASCLWLGIDRALAEVWLPFTPPSRLVGGVPVLARRWFAHPFSLQARVVATVDEDGAGRARGGVFRHALRALASRVEKVRPTMVASRWLWWTNGRWPSFYLVGWVLSWLGAAVLWASRVPLIRGSLPSRP